MALQVMTVSAARGVESDGNTSSEALFPYQFYAKINIAHNNTYVVNLVMPLGGSENGLFRYPRPGESILVDACGGSYYLMGYLPDGKAGANNFMTKADGQNTAEKQALWDEEAMVLRYEQTGKKQPLAEDLSDRYSEIGFYHKETQWMSTDPNYWGVPVNRDKDETDEAYGKRLEETYPDAKRKDGESDADYIARITTVFPHIDRINIKSAGDLYAAALNHQRLKAKRLDILVDCEDPDYTKAKPKPEELPEGDNVGDDSALHTGDAHLRASNRVVIKAGDEILLQVGRTVISIRDDALRIKSKLVNSNLTNAYDAVFELNGKDGVTLFGRDVNINGDRSVGLGDAFGGSVGSRLGVLSLGGREIKAETYDTTQYTLLVTYALGQYIQSVTAGSLAVNGTVDDAQLGDYIKFAVDTLKSGAELVKNITEVARGWKEHFKEKREAREAEERRRAQKALEDAALASEESSAHAENMLLNLKLDAIIEGRYPADGGMFTDILGDAETEVVNARNALAALTAAGGSEEDIQAANAKVTQAETNANKVRANIAEVEQMQADLKNTSIVLNNYYGQNETYPTTFGELTIAEIASEEFQSRLEPGSEDVKSFNSLVNRAREHERKLNELPKEELQRMLDTRKAIKEQITGRTVYNPQTGEQGVIFPDGAYDTPLDRFLQSTIASR